MILLDTHVLIWWVNEPEKLSSQMKKIIDKECREGVLMISSISIWEIAMLVAKGRLELTMDVTSWIEKVESVPFFEFIPVDNRVALRSVMLPEPFHADPADRMIVATAREYGVTLLTIDTKIQQYPHVRTVG